MLKRALQWLLMRCLDLIYPLPPADPPSVFAQLPYPGILLKVEDVVDAKGRLIKTYVWRHGPDEVSRFAVSDGHLVERLDNYVQDDDHMPWPFDRRN